MVDGVRELLLVVYEGMMELLLSVDFYIQYKYKYHPREPGESLGRLRLAQTRHTKSTRSAMNRLFIKKKKHDTYLVADLDLAVGHRHGTSRETSA